MSIETRGSMSKIFNDMNAREWAKEVRTDSPLNSNKNELGSFGDVLKRYIGQVNKLQVNANKEVQQLVTGKSKNIHETMLAVEKAEIAFKAMNQIRQKMLDAYREVTRMQV
jgi:flagellar hook-basal body complex protein FliE